MRICAIGCGDHAAFAHGPALRRYAERHADTELAACCDLRAEAAEAYASRFGFRRRYADYAEMLRAERPDMVDIVTPVGLTERIALDALSLGVACLVEKPPAADPMGVRRIMAAADRAGAPVRVAFNRRFMPLTRELMRLLAERPEDRIQLIAFDMHRYRRGGEDFAFTALHGIDLVRYVAQADYERVRFDYDGVAPDTVNIYMHGVMTNGVTVRLNFLPQTGRAIERLSVQTGERSFFQEASLHPDSRDLLTVYRNDRPELRLLAEQMADGPEGFARHGFYGEIASFAELVRTRKIDEISPIGQSLQSVAVACRIRDRAPHYQREES